MNHFNPNSVRAFGQLRSCGWPPGGARSEAAVKRDAAVGSRPPDNMENNAFFAERKASAGADALAAVLKLRPPLHM